ncbi:uncharacterized protein LOC117185949 [Drosophila miranda]|uniref:uncharacterized protein LOC117185949 n=1 Tax=Drosophila miranda TaxID=7229 RepID=UPI0007E7A38A|nr:uncharacterized protein LOC117185949 [Drosophila miranda]
MALNAKCLRVSCVIIAIGWIIGTIFTASYLVQADTEYPIVTLIMAISDFVTTAGSILGLIGAIKNIPLALVLWLLTILISRCLELVLFMIFHLEKKFLSASVYMATDSALSLILFISTMLCVTAISIFVIYEYYGYLRNKIRYNDE